MIGVKVEAFQRLVRSERAAARFIRKLCWKNYRRFCIRCRSYRVFVLRDGRYRCRRCRYTFGDLSGRWLAGLRIGLVAWLHLLKFFQLELSARKSAQELGLSYPTVLKGYRIMRQAIVAHQGDTGRLAGEVELDDTYFGGHRKGKRGRGAAGKIPVFGLVERGGRVTAEVVKDISTETVLGLTVKKVRRGSIVYTDRFKSYDSLMFCGYRQLKIDHKTRFVRGKVYINTLEGFWAFAKERLIKFHGVSKTYFPLYLKEMEFRYNHRREDIFELLAKYACNLVPDLL